LLDVAGGRLREHYIRRHKVDLELENRSASARKIYLALPYTNNAKVKGAEAVIFDHGSARAMAVFSLAAGRRAAQQLTVTEGLVRSHDFDALDVDALQRLAKAIGVSSKHQDGLRRALAHRRRQTQAGVALKRSEERLAQLDGELVELRKSVAVLGNKAARAGQPLIAMLLEAQRRRRVLVIDRRRHKATEKREKLATNGVLAAL
jgi:hypothetical protein